MPGEETHVVDILLVRFIPDMRESLHVGGETRYRLAGDSASRQKAMRRIAPGCAILKLLNATAVIVKRHRVEIDSPIVGVAHDEPRRQFILRRDEFEGGEGGLGCLCLPERNDAVEVIMIPRLCLDQRIDAPAAIEPDGNAGPAQSSDDLQYILS
jgi:hypothetical protein